MLLAQPWLRYFKQFKNQCGHWMDTKERVWFIKCNIGNIDMKWTMEQSFLPTKNFWISLHKRLASHLFKSSSAAVESIHLISFWMKWDRFLAVSLSPTLSVCSFSRCSCSLQKKCHPIIMQMYTLKRAKNRKISRRANKAFCGVWKWGGKWKPANYFKWTPRKTDICKS